MDAQQLAAFAFTGDNPLWTQTLSLLDTCLEEEIAAAIDPQTVGEARIHAAGRAEGLVKFRALLAMVRDEARAGQAPPVT